jgi:hypothetical protein
MTSVDVGRVVHHLLTDRRAFIENLLEVENKERRIGRFVPGVIQSDVLDNLVQPGGRHVFLKPSQVGFSTIVIALFFADTICTPGTTSVIVAHEEFITQRLLSKAQFFYDHLPAEFKPVMSHRSANEKFFPELNSVLYIGSARAHVFGRGEPIHNFLCDEYAFWSDPDRIMVPSLQRVPAWGRMVVGSTPNGEENAFNELYTAAKTGSSIWQHHFYPWYLHPEYRLPINSPLALPRDRTPELTNLDSEEEVLVRRGLDHNQLRWRRAKTAELEALRRDGTTRLLFGQEFPEDDVSCFLAAGDMVHDSKTLDNMSRLCYPAPLGFENCEVWEPPDPDFAYVVAVDPGQGRQTESAITVWRYIPAEEPEVTHCIHVATGVGFWDTEFTATKAAKLARYYNTATLVPEANSHGLAVISELRNVHKYPRLSNRRDPFTERISTDYGWLTTPRTKPFMVQEVSKHLPALECHDSRIISQIRGVRYPEGTSREGYIHIGLSDLYMSSAIGIVSRSLVGAGTGFAGVGGWNEKW